MVVEITAEMKDKADEFVKKIVLAKMQESGYKADHAKIEKRFYDGIIAEMVVYQQLGYTIDDVELDIGRTRDFSHCDLSNIGFKKTGIKCVDKENVYPIIYKKNKENQIICVISDSSVEVKGIATIDVLNTYQSDGCVKSPAILAKGYKTGFWGMDKLIEFNIDNLMALE